MAKINNLSLYDENNKSALYDENKKINNLSLYDENN